MFDARGKKKVGLWVILTYKATSESHLSGWNTLFSYRGWYNGWINFAFTLLRNLFDKCNEKGLAHNKHHFITFLCSNNFKIIADVEHVSLHFSPNPGRCFFLFPSHRNCKANPNAMEISLLLMWAQSAHDPYRFNCSECHSVIKFSIWVENLILFFQKQLPFFSGIVGT